HEKDRFAVHLSHAKFDPGNTVVEAVLDRILYQVLPDLAQARAISKQHQIRVWHLNVGLSNVDDAGKGVQNFSHQYLERYHDRWRFDTVDAGQLQQLVQQKFHLVGCSVDKLQVLDDPFPV